MHAIQAARRLTVAPAMSPVLCCLVLSSLMATIAAAAEQRLSPHRFVPAKGLIAYVEFDGLDAHAEAWKATSAHELLVETPAGSVMTELAKQILDRIAKAVPVGKVTGADLIAIHEHLVPRGFVVAVHDREDIAATFTIVLNGIGTKQIRERFDRVLLIVFGPEGGAKLPAPVRIRGRDVYHAADVAEKKPLSALLLPGSPVPGAAPAGTSSSALSWWYEGDDVVMIAGPNDDSAFLPDPAKKQTLAAAHTAFLAAVLDAIDGKLPNAATHSSFISALAQGKDIKGFESDGLFFIDSGSNTSLFGRVSDSLDALTILGAGAGSMPMPADFGLDAVPAPPPQVPAAVVGGIPAATPRAEVTPPPAADAPRSEFQPTALPPLTALDDLPPPPIRPGSLSTPEIPQRPNPDDVAKKEPDPAEILGLKGIKRIVGRWGFQGKALMTDVRIEAPAPRKGLVAWIDQPAFRKDRLPPFPQDTGAFAVDSLDLRAGYQKIVDGLTALNPELAGEIDQCERMIREATGLRLREDLLNHFGPTWSLVRLPSVDGDRGAAAGVDPTAYALLASVDDHEALGKVVDSIASRINKYLADAEKGDDKEKLRKKEVDPPILALARLPAPYRGYQLTSPARLVPWLDDEVRPTILVGTSFVACASNLERAREALAAESEPGIAWRPAGELVQAFACLPERLTFLAVGDHRDSAWPDAIAHLPSTVQTLNTFLGFDTGADAPAAGELLAALGIPRPGGFRVRIDPSKIPKADQLRPYLFPSVLAAAVDDQGFRLIAREALPLACFGSKVTVKSARAWTKGKGFDQKLKLDLSFFH
jgi:hypothetical protein